MTREKLYRGNIQPKAGFGGANVLRGPQKTKWHEAASTLSRCDGRSAAVFPSHMDQSCWRVLQH